MSIPNEWYYVKNNERCGPVDAARLKQLADAGEIQRDNLVWRAGMADWVEAVHVKGLFPETTPAAAPTAVEKREPSPAPSEGPAVTPQAEPQPSTIQTQKAGEGHPVAVLLNWLHAKVTDSFINASNRLFTTIGFWAIVLYAILLTTGCLISALKAEQYWQLGFALGVSILVLALQYPVVKTLKLLDDWKFESKVPRPLFDTAALLAILAGFGLLITITTTALKFGIYAPIFDGIAVFIVCIHLATAALSLPSKKSDSLEDAFQEEKAYATANEAQSLFSGLLAVILRTVPVAFGAGLSLSCLKLIYHMLKLGSVEEAGFFIINAVETVPWVLFCLLLPAAAYLASVVLRAAGRFILLRI